MKPCKATASSGAIKCALDRDHPGHHSSLKPGQKKTAQHVTWTTVADGRVEVTTYRGGKKDGNWFEGEAGSAHDPDDAEKAQLEPVKPPAKVSKIYTKAEREQQARDAEAARIRESVALGEREQMERSAAGRLNPSPASAVTFAGYPRHPAAALYEMLPEVELEKLAADIKANGLHEAIVILEERGHGSQDWILDGSNRARACEMAGVTPRFTRYDGQTDMASLIAYVVGKNDRRRHESEAQRAMRATEAANLAQGQRKETGPGSGLTQTEAAALVGVSDRSVRRAKNVSESGVPELVAAVKAGKVDLKGAEQVAKLSPAKQREIVKERIDTSKGPVRGGKLASLARQEEKRTIVRAINEQRVAPMPMGPFGVIYGDYPWLYDNSDQHEGSHGHLPYPGMPFEQVIEHAREASKRAAKDCIVALWVTNLYIPKIGLVLEAYGAEHRTMWTWPKPRIGVGGWARGQTEHLVIASIGDPVHTMNEISTLLPSYQPRVDREHSSKPVEVAELLLKHCSGPHLELFARAADEGWDVWGAETDKFSTEAA